MTAEGFDPSPGAPKPDPVLVVEGLQRTFGGLRAVDNIRLRARIVPDVDEVAIADDDCLGPRLLFVNGVDAAVGQHPVGGLRDGLAPASSGKREDKKTNVSTEAHVSFSSKRPTSV